MAAFVAAYAVLANWIFDFAGWLRHVEFGASREITEQYRMEDPFSARGLFSMLAWTGALFVRSAGPAGAALMLLGAWWGWRRKPEAARLLLLPALAYYLLYPLLRAVIYPRFLLPAFLPLLLLGTGATIDLLSRGGRARAVGAIAALLLAVVAWRGAEVNRLWSRDPRAEAADWIAKNVAPGTRLLVVGNEAVTPPPLPDAVEYRWANAREFVRAKEEFKPQLFVRMLSTNLSTVIVPQFPPWDQLAAPGSGLTLLAAFGRDLYLPQPLHPILMDIDAAPGVAIYRID